jgi:hypothetical protein
MSLNPLYVVSPSLQRYFVDKDSGMPLSGGKLFFYSDVNRSIPKSVYMLAGNQNNYSYVALPNPVILSGVGTMQDNNGNDIIEYYFPWDDLGDPELYYIVAQSSIGVPQFTRQAWPNPSTNIEPGGEIDLFNYIPNGQFLAHTNVPSATNELVSGSNVIAQGGFSIELPDPVNSTNTVEFIPLNFLSNPTQSPRFELRFTCTTFSTQDDIKTLRIKFNDVNKFSATDDFYTFAFSAIGNVNIPIAIQVYKFFGSAGSVVPAITKATDTITTTGPEIYDYSFQFGSNSGYTVDTINNDDFVAIDITFPNNFGFSVDMTNFMLILGAQNITEFPIQTNADMISRGVDGWTDVPAYSGYDLYLPKVLTRYGYKYDRSSIGNGHWTFKTITSPTSALPLPESNDMVFDGASYIYNNYSSIGIPFARLGDVLLSSSPIDGIPLYGTGSDFATAYKFSADEQQFRLAVNKNGSGIASASDFSTGWTFTPMVEYNGSLTGSASIEYSAYSNVANTVLCVADFQPFDTPDPLSPAVDFDTGFTITELIYETDLVAQQKYAFTVLCTAASTLVAGTGNPGKYFSFGSTTTDYYMWFYFNGELDPAPTLSGFYPVEGIKVTLDSSYNAQDVANIVREVMSAYQLTAIKTINVPTAGQFWLFSTNPGASINYYVWYSIDGLGIDPQFPGAIGIEVELTQSDDIIITTEKTWRAIDKYKYATGDFRGMFLRGADFDAAWDLDVAQRWSNVSGLSGANMGTFEFQQFLSHYHKPEIPGNEWFLFGAGAVGVDAVSDLLYQGSDKTANTGGTETRPVNAYVNFVIKY